MIDEENQEHSEENRAYSRIAEEEERERRIAEDAYKKEIQDSLDKAHSAANRAYSRMLEEEEKKRRVKENEDFSS